MNKNKFTNLISAIFIGSFIPVIANATLSENELNKLSSSLTPMGAERAGNIEGTIPPWDGGIKKALSNWPNDKNERSSHFDKDSILFSIESSNYKKFEEKLTPGTIALLNAYPDHFKLNIYPSRRSAAFPDTLYRAIKENAPIAELTKQGSIKNVWGSIPFPIPKNGIQVIWNHLLRYQGSSRQFNGNENIVFNNGSRQDWFFESVAESPFYDPNASESDKKDGIFLKQAITITKPSRDSGEGYLAIDALNMSEQPRKAWTYDPGERRVRRAPNLAFDTPDRSLNVIDDFEVFSGSPEKYDWKLLGKKEIYIPYNNNKLNSPLNMLDDVLGKNYLNYELIRYELHRVWVVEGTVKQGARHIYAKRVQYIDEDTWNIIASDKYDSNGELWRVSFSYPVVASEIPLTAGGVYTNVDLKMGGYYISGLPAEGVGYLFNGENMPNASYFSPAALRRRGK